MVHSHQVVTFLHPAWMLVSPEWFLSFDSSFVTSKQPHQAKFQNTRNPNTPTTMHCNTNERKSHKKESKRCAHCVTENLAQIGRVQDQTSAHPKITLRQRSRIPCANALFSTSSTACGLSCVLRQARRVLQYSCGLQLQGAVYAKRIWRSPSQQKFFWYFRSSGSCSDSKFSPPPLSQCIAFVHVCWHSAKLSS